MAERERLTKAERRERSRAERRQKEAEAAKKQRRQRLVSWLVTALVLAGIGAVVFAAFGEDDTVIDEAIVLGASEVADAEATAGCEVLAERNPFGDSTHYDAATAPPADALYRGVTRPTHSGPHFAQTHPVVRGGAEDQLDERAITHNLEHGAIAVWYDPEQVDADTIGAMEAWAESLNDSGFAHPRGGGAIFLSPYVEPGIASGKAIALRAWGTAVDCDTWNETVASGFVLDHFGTHGIAPERPFSPFPEQVLQYDPEDTPEGFGEDADAPVEGEEPADGTDAETGDAGTGDAGTDGATDETSPTDTES